MNTWQEFYNTIKAETWPECPNEDDFVHLPSEIQNECIEVFGYVPNSFKKKSKLVQKIFPIKLVLNSNNSGIFEVEIPKLLGLCI